ncbi:MAG TPA: response regulator transcription factor [Baekduia sp.]|nr:response regulator transcription factor [Baekduia sp.]
MSHLMAPSAPLQSPTIVAAPAPARAIRILVVDHHPVVQHGVRLFLDGQPRFTVVGSAETGAQAIVAARHDRPDVALLEPWLPDMLLEDLVERLRASSPNTRLIAFASQVTPTLRDEVATLGIHGLLGKGAAPEDVAAMVARVAAGETVTPPPSDSVLRQAAEKLHCAVLTAREHEILRLAARGASNSEIASEIFLAPTTVKSYLQSALAKLGARNRVEAVYKLGEVGLL